MSTYNKGFYEDLTKIIFQLSSKSALSLLLSDFVEHLKQVLSQCSTNELQDQRTNGPVNAHLISGPTVSTKKKNSDINQGP